MKKLTLSIAALALFTTTFAQTLDRSIRPKAGPAPVINLKDAQTFTLPNGLKVFVVQNNKIPMVSYSFQFDVDPVVAYEKSGLEDIVGQMMTSGTKTLSKEQFDEAKDKIGANIAASGAGLFGSSMTKHQDALLGLMSDVLLNANFKEAELDKLKTQSKAGLEQSKTDPDAMLSNVTAVLNYGKNHPYAQLPTDKSIGNIDLKDINNYYTTYYRPNVAYLAVVGDIKLEDAKKLVTKYFGKWQKAEVPKAKFPQVSIPTTATVDFVPRDNSVQSVIGVSYPVNLKPGTPDVVKARMLNEILGGSGTGRLFLNLREKHGWTYGSYSSLNNDKEIGSFQAYAKARNEVTDSSVNEILAEMNRIRNEKVDPTTLQEMKNYVNGTFAIGLESPQTIARYAINIDRYKMPKDYYKNYIKSVNEVSVDDIQATAKKYIKPDASRIIVVGDKSEAPKLKRFASNGEINYFDNYGSPISAPVAKAAEYGVSAQSVVEKYIKAIGGAKAVEGIKTLSTIATTEMQGQSIQISQKVASPDKYLMSVMVPGMGEVQRIAVNGNKGVMSGMGQTQEMDAEMVGAFAEQADLQMDLHPEKYGYKLNLKGVETVDNKECYVIEKTNDKGYKVVSYYDTKDYLLVKEVKTDKGGQSQTTIFSNFKEVKGGNGYKAPHTIINQTPQGKQEIIVDKMEANVTIKDSEFK